MLLDIDNQYNINHKYRNYFHILPEEFNGSGVRRAHQYTSLVSEERVAEVVEQFWETRIEGNSTVWAKIREALATPTDSECRDILKEKRLMLVSDSIQLIIDRKGLRYELPVFVLHSPAQYDIRDTMAHEFQARTLKINFRSQLGNLELEVENSTQIAEVKGRIRGEQGLGEEKRVKLFYCGREMQEGHQVGNYKVKGHSSVSVFIC